ncbi:MAG: carboxypeptidase regulatory-like domain-containing protein [Prevotella sp.]|nr:carboxypeptidase regulatory-like domain-containing protein [Prevotella sp.]
MKKLSLLLLMMLTLFGYGQVWAQDLLFVGDADQQTTYGNRLIAANQTQSYSETIYKKADLTAAGLEEGTGIKRIVYKGIYTGDTGTIPVMVWIGNTTDDAPATTQYVEGSTTEYNYDIADPDELGMTLIYDGDYTVSAPGDDGIIMEFAVPNSFRYAGNNLRVMVVKPESDAKLNRPLNAYCAKSTFTDFKNTMFRQNTGIFSLVSSPFLWIETGVASEHNFKITETNLPTQATINEPFEASFTIVNQGIDEEAGGYTVKYYFDDVEVATAEAVAVDVNATQTFTFTYTPTALGRHTSYAEIVFPDGASVKTSKVSMKVEEANPRWSWDFEDQTWPEGSDYSQYKIDSYVHLAANGYYLSPTDYSPGTNPIFITPLLHAEDGETFYFEAAKYGASFFGYTLTVSVSKDRKTWTTVKTIEEEDYTGAQVGGSSSSDYDFSEFNFTIAEGGDYYIMFNGGARLDNFYGFALVEKAHDIISVEENLPTEGMVNNEVTATWTVKNLKDATETATAKYYINGTAVAEAASQSLTTRTEKTFSFTFMPHETGTFNSYIELTLADGSTVRSSEVEITFSEEEPKGEALIGNYYSYGTSIPVQTSSTGSYSDMIWTASDLQSYGITAGTMIKGIVFKGYSSSEVSAPVQVWIGSTEATSPVVGSDPTDDLSNTTGMTKVFDGSYTFKKGGSYGEANMVDIMTITLAEPFEYDGTNLRIHAQCVQEATQTGVNFAQSNLYTAAYKAKSTWSDSYYGNDSSRLPWIALLYDKEASHFTGTLTIKNADQTVTPIAGTTITLTSEDGVTYSGTTDSEGQFDFEVMQDTKTYTLSHDYTEKNCFPMSEDDLTVTFQGTSLEKDIQLVEGVDFKIESFDAPTTATTNNVYTATVTATNYNATTLTAADYTATLYVDGKAVAEAESVDVASMESVTLTFTFTPHEAGTFNNCYIALAAPTTTVQTDAYTLTVAAESAGGEVQVGNKNGTSNKTPFYWFDADADGGVMTDFAYTPEMLATFGVNANSKITKITFKKSGGSDKNFSQVNLTVWVGMEDATTTFTAGAINKSEMQEYVIYNGVAANSADDVVLDMSAAPIVYDGTSRIRLYVENNGHGSYAFTTYDYDNTSGGLRAYYKKASASSWTQDSGTPVAYFTLAAASHFTGSVKNASEEAVAGAKVTLRNDANDVEYSATTGEDGTFDVEVVQTDKTYTVTVEAEGYITLTPEGTVDLSSGDSEGNNYVLDNGIDITIATGATGTSYSGPYALNFSAAEVKAYKAVEKVETGGVRLTPVTIVPAETGIVVKGTPGTYHIPLATTESADDYSDNLLVANLDEVYTVTAADYGYVYRYVKTSTGKTGFQKAKAGQTVSVGKAYLRLATPNANDVLYVDETTGIDSITQENHNGEGAVWNTSGQRVGDNYRGIVIKQGKKYVRK